MMPSMQLHLLPPLRPPVATIALVLRRASHPGSDPGASLVREPLADAVEALAR